MGCRLVSIFGSGVGFSSDSRYVKLNSSMQPFSINLGTPRHGWLPFTIKVGDYSLSGEASDLGLNVIDQLISMVGNLVNNKAAECYFYLEPAAYFLKLEPTEDTTMLKIQFVDDFDTSDNQGAETLNRTKIDSDELCKALIDALKGFRKNELADDDWPITDNWDLLNGLEY